MTLAPPQPRLGTTAPRAPQLDGLRGLAILMVVAYHSTSLNFSDVIWVRALMVVPWMGWAGVDLFFVLSGFLITRILLVHRGAPNYFSAFYARRALRILPLYYAVLLFFLIVVPWLDLFSAANNLWLPNTNRETISYWLFLGNYHAGLLGQFRHLALGITWSLAIEEQFYLVWPQLVSRISLTGLKKICYAMMLGSLGLRVISILFDANAITIYTVTPFRLDGLAVGAWIAARIHEDGCVEGLARESDRLMPWALGSLALIIGLLVYDPHFLGVKKTFTLLGHPLMQTLGYSAIAIAMGTILVRLLSAPEASRWRRIFEYAPLRKYGTISFGLYLIHVPVLQIVAVRVYHPQDTQWIFAFEQILYYFVVLVPATALAALSWWAFESRVLAFRRYAPFQVLPSSQE